MPLLEVVPYPRHAMWHTGPSLEVVLAHFQATKDSNKPLFRNDTSMQDQQTEPRFIEHMF